MYVPPCVSLSAWPQSAAPSGGSYTTVSHWWSDGADVELDGSWLDNSKRTAFAPILDVAARADVPLELALGGLDDVDERSRLQAHGWQVSDAAASAGSPAAFARFVRRSRGELSAAKPSYVAMRTGWLSDRSVCYLASGRPAIVQDTGGELGHTGHGLLRFNDASGALAALADVEADYPAHCRAARELAEHALDGRRTVERLLERLL